MEHPVQEHRQGFIAGLDAGHTKRAAEHASGEMLKRFVQEVKARCLINEEDSVWPLRIDDREN